MEIGKEFSQPNYCSVSITFKFFDLAKREYLKKRIVYSLYENVQVGKKKVLSRYERLSVCTIILPVTRRLRIGGKFVVSNLDSIMTADARKLAF